MKFGISPVFHICIQQRAEKTEAECLEPSKRLANTDYILTSLFETLIMFNMSISYCNMSIYRGRKGD